MLTAKRSDLSSNLYGLMILIISLLISGCIGGASSGESQSTSTPPLITSFSVAGVSATIDQNALTISVSLPAGTNVRNLIASFETSPSASVKVGDVIQISGISANDFTNSVSYTVGNGNGQTTYSVVVIEINASANAFTAFSINGVTGSINEATKTINVTLPAVDSLGITPELTNLKPSFSTTGQQVFVGSSIQTSGKTSNDFTLPVKYIVSSADNRASIYTVTVSLAAGSAKAFTYFYIGGSLGVINDVDKTITVNVPSGTNVTSLVANYISTGISEKVGAVVQASSVTRNDFTSPVNYTIAAADGSTATYTVTVIVALNGDKALTAFSINGIVGVINESIKTIYVAMPSGTNKTSLSATFSSTGKSVFVGSKSQISAVTTNDFTAPIVYTVKALDGSTVDYTVTVTVAAASQKSITSFTISGVTGSINETTKTVSVTLPIGTNVTSLTPVFSTTGVGVATNGTPVVSGSTSLDFTLPVIYDVTAADNTSSSYVVTVTVAVGNSNKAITSFSINNSAGIIDEGNKTINVFLPTGTLLVNLIPTFTSTGAGVSIHGTNQVSGATANDFSSSVSFPVPYVVTASDSTTATYSVSVTATSYVSTFAGSGTVGNTNGTGIASSFFNPKGIALDNLGNIYVADSGNNKIRKITPAGVVTTLAGSGAAGRSDGTGMGASFNSPTGLVVDQPTGDIYVADSGNNRIRRISSGGLVTTYAGTTLPGSADGIAASFNYPTGITIGTSGLNRYLFVADRNNHSIRRITIGGYYGFQPETFTIAGSTVPGLIDGTGSSAAFNYPSDLVFIDPYLYVTDTSNNVIRRISDPIWATSLIPASVTQIPVGTNCLLPKDIDSEINGKIFYTCIGSNQVMMYHPGVGTRAIYGSGVNGTVDGPISSASFTSPWGIATDFTNGNVYVSDGSKIRLISP